MIRGRDILAAVRPSRRGGEPHAADTLGDLPPAGERPPLEEGVEVVAIVEANAPVQITDGRWQWPRGLELPVQAVLPAPAPAELFDQYLQTLRAAPRRLQAKDRRLVAAVLVEFTYTWNTYAEWRRTRNLVVAALEALRPMHMRRAIGAERERTRLRVAVEPLLLAPLLVASSESPFLSQVRDLLTELNHPSDVLMSKGAALSANLQARCKARLEFPDHIVRIPGVDATRRPREVSQRDVAMADLAVDLIGLLRRLYGSDRNTVSDAHEIVTRVFGNVLPIPAQEAFSRSRWDRLKEHPGRAWGPWWANELAGKLEALPVPHK